jgi:hypothetical protein
MATNFPTSLDSLTNPAAGDSLSSPSHSAQHANVNDAVEALQAKVGVDGSAVTSSLDYKVANQGLTLVKSQTIGSGTAAVTVTGAFSSTFDNYRVVVEVLDASTALSLRFRLGSTTTNYYSSKSGLRYNGGTFSGVVNNNATYMDLGSCGSDGGGSMTFDVVRPYITDRTLVNGTGSYAQASTGGYILYAGFVNDNTSYTAFTFLTSAGTISNGNIRVYGYNNG